MEDAYLSQTYDSSLFIATYIGNGLSRGLSCGLSQLIKAETEVQLKPC